jgi:3-methyladenine DNA glycosylase AlkD
MDEINQLLGEIHERMTSAADPNHRDGVMRFFTEPDGRTVDAYGVRQPAMKPIEQFAYAQVKHWTPVKRNRFCAGLWKNGKLESGGLVCWLYRRFARQCGAAEFKLFEGWIDRYVTNWANCDGVSSWLVAASIGNEPTLIPGLTSWTRSRNRWKRRAAAVSLLQEAKQGRHTTEILAIAEALRCDRDPMVQKGVGWLLKETYPKQPQAVVDYLDSRRETTPRLVLRYAAEKMTAQDKALVMRK